MPSPILARADALMQRRHQSSADQSDLPILTDAIETDDDLPVLNDIAFEANSSQLTAVPELNPLLHDGHYSPLPAQEDSEHQTLASELAHQVEQRILAQLPQLIDSAIKDLIAEQKIDTPTPRQD